MWDYANSSNSRYFNVNPPDSRLNIVKPLIFVEDLPNYFY